MRIVDRIWQWRKERHRLAEAAARMRAARRATLDALSLTQADRALALVLARPATLPCDGSARADGLDAYTAAFVSRNAGVGFARSDGHGPVVCDPEDEASRGGLLVVAVDEGDAIYGTRPGSTEVFADGGGRATTSAASSIAHLGLDLTLADDELRALSAAPDTWTPDPQLRPVAPDLAFEQGPMPSWPGAFGNAVVMIAGVGFFWLALVAIDRSIVAALVALAIGLGVVPWNARRLFERAWLERIARGLDIDREGMNDVRTGERVTWSAMRDVELRSRRLVVTFPSGRRAHIPTSLWLDREATLDWILKEAGKRAKRPYR